MKISCHPVVKRVLTPLILFSTISITAWAQSSMPSSPSEGTPASPALPNDPAQSRSTDTDRSRSTNTRAQERFLSKAHENSQRELRLSQLAADRASNPEVRGYARQLVDDHQQMGSDMAVLVSQQNIGLNPGDTDEKQQQKLLEKSGADFDKAYIKLMVQEHKKAVNLFEDASEERSSPEVRSFAAKYLPGLREHLARAQQIEKTLD